MCSNCPLCDGEMHEKTFTIDISWLVHDGSEHATRAARCKRCKAVSTIAGVLVEQDDNILFFDGNDCVLLRQDGIKEYAVPPQFDT